MFPRIVPFALVLALVGCTAPQPSNEPAIQQVERDNAALAAKVGELSQRVQKLEWERTGNAPPPSVTIDQLSWSGGYAGQQPPSVMCRIVDFPGPGKFANFVHSADSLFYFEAEGQPAVEAKMNEGTLANTDGSKHWGLLWPQETLTPNVKYYLRPRNKHSGLRWKLADDLVLTRL